MFDNDTQFNSIDSGFVEEYILQPQPSDEQVHLRAWKFVEVYYSLFFRPILYILLVRSYDMMKKFCLQTDLIS